MTTGLQRRNEQFVQEIFNKHKGPPDSAGLSKESLVHALSDLGIPCASTSEVDELFYSLDLNSDGWISWSEFLMVISKPSKVEEWATTLQLAALLANCMPSKDEADPLRALSKLCSADIHAVSACFSEGLVQLLRYVSLSLSYNCVLLHHPWRDLKPAKVIYDGSLYFTMCNEDYSPLHEPKLHDRYANIMVT
jgi:hypothetical protein